jgi:carboxylesterase type B
MPLTLYLFAPIVDGTFLQDRPVEAFKAGMFVRVPVLTGSNTDEGARWSERLSVSTMSSPNATEESVFDFLQGQFNGLTKQSFGRAIKMFYPLDKYEISLQGQKYVEELRLRGQQMYGEARYICSAALISGTYSQNAYHYHYDNPHLGSRHKAELEAFFEMPKHFTIPPDEKDNALFHSMREYWMSFVTAGRPVSKNGITWEPVKVPDSGNTFIFLQPGNVSMQDQSPTQSQRCAFWHDSPLTNEMQT